MLNNALVGTKKYAVFALFSASLMECNILQARTLWESDDTQRNVSVIGFAHLDVAEVDPDSSNPVAEQDEGFQEARVALHLSSRFGRRFTTFVESELTVTEDDVKVSLERAVVKYDVDNNSQLSAGRYHAPVGYWNQFYHHGRWLQNSKDRPVQSEFGSGFLPAHYWGAMYERRAKSENYVVDVDFGVGSGRESSFSLPGFAGPVTLSGEESITAQVNISPKNNRSLVFGGSFWVGNLKADNGLKVSEEVATLHLAYSFLSGDLLGEVSLVNHGYNNGLEDSRSYGGYVQYSHKLNSLGGRLKPYVRLDYLNVDQEDLLYSSIESLDRQTLGVRFESTDNVTLKFELRRDDFSDVNESSNSLHGQIASFF